MAPTMFKVKAVYDYSSPHDDDLSFTTGQIITVTEEEDADWYVGEYVDDSGTKHDGLFPRNFVERFEPQPPPRPNRATRQQPVEQPPAAEPAPPTPVIPQQEPEPESDTEPVQHDEPEARKPQPPPLQVPPTASEPKPSAVLSPTSPRSAQSSIRSPEDTQSPAEAPVKASAPGKKAPPPVAVKSNAFRDRIAAFNQPAAAPIQPFKASAPPPTFVKKPFVAPPPSRNAYVPPPKEAPQVKTYRREEDPEIADRQAQDQEAAEKSGLTSSNTQANEAEDEGPKLSLKERIALLQKQQQEQAERAAAAMQPKEKPKRPVQKKRLESHEGQAEDSEDTELEKVVSAGSTTRASTDHARPPRPSHDIKSPESLHHDRDLLSDANDADQSGAGETEDQGDSTSVEGDDKRTASHQPPLPQRAPAAPTREPDVGDEQDVAEEEEEEEEDEMDAETRRKLELRERMAKMSGGMGMPGMFGGIPMGGLPPKKKKSTGDSRKAEDSEEPSVPQQRVAMFPMPGMPVRSPEPENRQLAVEKEDENDHPVTGAHAADEVPDVEDVTPQAISRTPTGESAPPVPQDSKYLIPRKPINSDYLPLLRYFPSPYSETVSKTYLAFDEDSDYVMTVSVSRRPAPPPVPTADRVAPPVPAASRPVPPPLPPIASPGPGSESGDELTDAIQSPRSPPPPFPPPSKRASYFSGEEQTPDSPDRRVPPIPLASPTSPSARLPPPPPPSAAPGAHRTELPIRKLDHETDYEGDYDTDIASGATHKDALKSHAREPSLDASTIGGSPVIPHGIPPLPTVPRAVPPPPPQQPPGRPSMDAPRGAPPLPPVPPPARAQEDDDDEYDPYKYTSQTVASPPTGAPPVPRGMPPLPQSRPPPPMPPAAPPVPQHQQVESSEDDDLYSAPAPRKSHDRPPPPPPQAPPHMHAPPPLPQERAPPPPPPHAPPPMHAPPPPQAPPPPVGVPFQTPQVESQPRSSMGGRKSLDAGRTLQSRVSMDQQRPQTSQDFMATAIDLGASSHWWTQPKMLPPSLQARKDVLVDLQESQSGNTVEKLVSVLFMDYSQTIISARFDSSNVSDVELDQRQEPPPPRLRPDQLESAYEQFGRKIGKDAESKQSSVVGNGTPFGFVDELLKLHKDALPPVSTRAYGALVYANLANASTQSHDEIRPGDIVTFRNAKFQGKAGAMHAKYSVDVGKPDHVGVVVEWDGSKKKVRVWEQGREHKKVKPESFRMGDLRSGEVRVWRVMSKSWVGWN
ncbi:assembly of actin patch protein [Didymella glomerata]|uniref:Assembly of actin patch protein n=1 Tax=Didymella glomerata TaxID=749621 RepID=A0A9W8WSL6_9PLEO|nr:assembly of actin patch protein [Didymella glomerata]